MVGSLCKCSTGRERLVILASDPIQHDWDKRKRQAHRQHEERSDDQPVAVDRITPTLAAQGDGDRTRGRISTPIADEVAEAGRLVTVAAMAEVSEATSPRRARRDRVIRSA
jgi:hypothetical protein